MIARLLERVILPVATEDDTQATCNAIEPYLDGIDEIVLAHVVEQTPGYMDHASPEGLEEDARRFMQLALDQLGQEAVTDVVVCFGEDATEEVVALAREREATAILFHPRDKGLLDRLADSTHESELIRASPVPVIALPSPDRSFEVG